MEKRLLIAFLLSFLVLTVWNAINPRPKPVSLEEKYAQPIEDAVDRESKPSQLEQERLPISLSNQQKVERIETEEETVTLENEKLLAEFSNIGGILKKVIIKEYNTELPITNIINVENYEDAGFRAEGITGNQVTYVFEENGVKITKRYSLSKDDYLIFPTVTIENGAEASIEGFTLDTSRMDKEQNGRNKTLFEYSIATSKKTHRKSNAFKFAQKEEKSYEEGIEWFGFRNRYFCIVVKPEGLLEKVDVVVAGEKILKIKTRMSNKEQSLDSTREFAASVYVGPQKLEQLSSYDLGFEEIMKFSNMGFLDAIAKGIYKLMNFIYGIIPNWGICIILISLTIYGCMYPLTMKGMMSMRKMQALQPKITKLREQHKSNPQKLNKEMMELYKEHKINPLGGCFPLLLQMPVFIGLYQVLWRSVSFKGASFLWIKDLSEPDRLFIFPFSLPIIGNEFNILPILMIIIMVFQQKFSAKNMVVADSAQAAQQKMMMTIFPVFIGFIFYKFASGLSLYFTVFYILSTLTQWKMSKMVKVVE